MHLVFWIRSIHWDIVSLKSGELAGDAVVSALEKNDLSVDRLGCWGEDYVRGMDRMRRLVYEVL